MILTQIHRIAIADTEDTAMPLQSESQLRTGIWYDTALLILYLDSYNGKITPISSDRLTICLQHRLCGRLGGLDGLCCLLSPALGKLRVRSHSVALRRRRASLSCLRGLCSQ